MKISLEIHSGDVNNDSGLSEFSIHFFPESLIHISPESLFTISRNDYSHAPEYALGWRRSFRVALSDRNLVESAGGLTWLRADEMVSLAATWRALIQPFPEM